MKKLLLGVAVVSILLLVLPAVIGLAIDDTHVASSRAQYQRPVDEIWATISDFAGAPAWREGVESMERLGDEDGKPVWVEHSSFGPMPYVVEVFEPPHRLVTRIHGEDLGFGGTWTYEVEAAGEGSAVTITENGVIDNPIFRTLSRFVFGYHATQQQYLTSLGRKFGEQVEPVVVQ